MNARPTVCVTGAGAGVDNAWEQEKLEAGKMFEKPQKPQRPVHALLGGERMDKRLLYGVVSSSTGRAFNG